MESFIVTKKQERVRFTTLTPFSLIVALLSSVRISIIYLFFSILYDMLIFYLRTRYQKAREKLFVSRDNYGRSIFSMSVNLSALCK